MLLATWFGFGWRLCGAVVEERLFWVGMWERLYWKVVLMGVEALSIELDAAGCYWGDRAGMLRLIGWSVSVLRIAMKSAGGCPGFSYCVPTIPWVR